MSKPLIDPNEVGKIFEECLSHTKAPDLKIGEAIAVEGIVNKYLLDMSKLDKHRDRITEMLMLLPKPFRRSDGGGWSFLQACSDLNGTLWTGLHVRMEQLMVLGIGIGKVEIPISRSMWTIFPGGMPYFVIKD